MAQNVYECLFILDSNRYARDPNAADSQITEMIQQRGGEVLISRRWNEQKLAFPINGHRKGTYWLSYFRMDSNEVVQFERACRLNDQVLRNLTVKVDERLVDTLVAHAAGEKVPGDEPADADSKPADADSKPADADSKPADADSKPADADSKEEAADAESASESPPAEESVVEETS